MKRYSLGVLAAVLAIMSYAFTNPSFKPRTMVDLRFVGTTLSELSVENQFNWVEGSAIGCNSTNDRACKITIDDTKLSGMAPNRHLNSSLVTVNADVGGEVGRYKVTTLTGSPGTHTIINKD